MGYTTYFDGQIEITPAVTPELRDYINNLANTRRMARDVEKLHKMYKGQHGLDGGYGIQGEFFALDDHDYGQSENESILNYNQPPSTQPGLWLQWNITEDGKYIEWDEGEKFYCADDWMDYLVNTILAPRGYVCNGEITADGEDSEDNWVLKVEDNIITVVDLVLVPEDDVDDYKQLKADVRDCLDNIEIKKEELLHSLNISKAVSISEMIKILDTCESILKGNLR